MRIALMASLLLVSTGCSKSDGEKTVSSPEGTIKVRDDRVEVQTEEGAVTFQENKVPDGFVIPVMKAASIDGSTHMTQPDGLELFQLSIRASSAVDDVVGFYEKFFKENGVVPTRNDQTDQGNRLVILFGSAEGREASAMVSREAGADETTAVVSWSQRKQ